MGVECGLGNQVVMKEDSVVFVGNVGLRKGNIFSIKTIYLEVKSLSIEG